MIGSARISRISRRYASNRGHYSPYVKRVDFLGRLDAKARTPQGGLRVSANLTRTGIFLYQDVKGGTVREYRPPSEVFKADSLDTLKLAPLVVGHPDFVRSDNFKALAVGIVTENVHANGQFVTSDVLVQDRSTVDRVDSGDLVELSCGYEVDLVATPGTTPEGEHYDAIQTNIRYNHVGLGPRNWGRAGSAVKLKLDGTDDAVAAIRLDSAGDVDIAPYTTAMTVKVDAEVISGARLDAEVKRADKAEAERDEAKARADEAVAKLAEAVDNLSKVQASYTNHVDSAAIPALVAARVALEGNARAILGPDTSFTKADGAHMSDLEVMTAALAKHAPSLKLDGLTADYVRARFDAACDGVKSSIAAVAGLNVASTPKGDASGEKSRLDAAHEKAAAEAKAAHVDAPPAGAMVRK